MAQPTDGSRRSYRHPCLIAQSLDVLGDRWTLIILRDLMAGLQHFGDILKNSRGLSPNVLSARLKRLEQEGLIERLYERGLPPRVEYALTEKGWAVRPILIALMEWSGAYFQGITPDLVGESVSADFAVRVIPAFSFEPDKAGDLEATMLVEISDCTDCNQWTFSIVEGRFLPRREAHKPVDVTLRTDTSGFFRFIRGEAPAADCGEIIGDARIASAIQSCFRDV